MRINNEEGARAYSQLYGVVRMIDIMLNRKQLNCALRVGRGRVYQVTVLAQLGKYFYTVERIKPLYERARKQLIKFEMRNDSMQMVAQDCTKYL